MEMPFLYALGIAALVYVFLRHVMIEPQPTVRQEHDDYRDSQLVAAYRDNVRHDWVSDLTGGPIDLDYACHGTIALIRYRGTEFKVCSDGCYGKDGVTFK